MIIHWACKERAPPSQTTNENRPRQFSSTAHAQTASRAPAAGLFLADRRTPPSLHPSPPPLSSWVAVVVVSSHEDSLGATCVGSGYISRGPCRVFQGDVCRWWVCMLAAGGCLCVLFCLLSYFGCLCFIFYSLTHLTVFFFYVSSLSSFASFLSLSRLLPLFSLFYT